MRKGFFFVFLLLAVHCNGDLGAFFKIPEKIFQAFGDVLSPQQKAAQYANQAQRAQPPQTNAQKPGPSGGTRQDAPQPLGVAGDSNYQSFGRATNTNYGNFSQSLNG